MDTPRSALEKANRFLSTSMLLTQTSMPSQTQRNAQEISKSLKLMKAIMIFISHTFPWTRTQNWETKSDSFSRKTLKRKSLSVFRDCKMRLDKSILRKERAKAKNKRRNNNRIIRFIIFLVISNPLVFLLHFRIEIREGFS